VARAQSRTRTAARAPRVKIALLPGDGVGREVIAEARKAVDATGLAVEWTELPWGSAYWHEHGRMMPEDGIDPAGTRRDPDGSRRGPLHPRPGHFGASSSRCAKSSTLGEHRPARLLEGMPARWPRPGRRGHGLRAREHRGGVRRRGRPRPSRPAARDGNRDECLHARMRRASRPPRLHARATSLATSSRTSPPRFTAGSGWRRARTSPPGRTCLAYSSLSTARRPTSPDRG